MLKLLLLYKYKDDEGDRPTQKKICWLYKLDIYWERKNMKVEFFATGIEEALSNMNEAIAIYKEQGFHVEYMAVTTSASKNYYVSITFR